MNVAAYLVYGRVSGGPDCYVIAEQGGRPTLGLHGPDLARGPEVAHP